jgi:hypothetical protein
MKVDCVNFDQVANLSFQDTEDKNKFNDTHC